MRRLSQDRASRSFLAVALLVLFSVVVSACLVAARPPPPPPPRLLSAPEAVAVATDFARSRGLVVDYTVAARLDRRARWHVEVGGAGGRDLARVVLDGRSGRVLRARLRAAGGEVPPQLPPPPDAQPEGPPPPAPPPPPAGSPGAGPPPPAPGASAEGAEGPRSASTSL
jgi:hypothetical protein